MNKNLLIWYANYRNKNKTFWIGLKQTFPQADRFYFGPKILGPSKAIWNGLKIVLSKIECFYLIQKQTYWSKTFWFGLLIIGTKAKHFDFVLNHKQIVSILAQKFRTKQSNSIWSGNCLRQCRTFLFNPKTYRSKQNVLNWSP